MARILVVEDDADSRRLLCYRLRRVGHVVEEAATGEAALRLLSEAEYDLVMLDVVLPGMSGWQVTRQLASDDRSTRSPILFISVMDRDDIPQDIVVRGWLAKPFTSNGLNDAVEEILDDTG